MADRALVIIDFQKDYFAGGNMELEGADAAAGNAARAFEQFRRKGFAGACRFPRGAERFLRESDPYP